VQEGGRFILYLRAEGKEASRGRRSSSSCRKKKGRKRLLRRKRDAKKEAANGTSIYSNAHHVSGEKKAAPFENAGERKKKQPKEEREDICITPMTAGGKGGPVCSRERGLGADL